MDSKESTKKSYNKKNKMGAPIVLQASRDLDLNEENEVKQSLLEKPELESCLIKNGRKDRGDSAKKVQWKDDIGKRLVQVKEFPPDDSDDSDEEFVDVCICTVM